MFLSVHSFDPGLLVNTMFQFLPSIFPKSILHIEKAGLCLSGFPKVLHRRYTECYTRTPSFTALWTQTYMRADWCSVTPGDC